MALETTNFRTRDEQRIEAAFGAPVEQVIRDLYHVSRLNQAEVAHALGVSRATVGRWMQRHGIPTGYNRAAAS